MANEVATHESFSEKLLFYSTAFFILLAIFSLFAFLFLVPFVIEPAFTTIFMKFSESPVSCVTTEVVNMTGQSNCSWTSCKEGCTKEIYECTQVRVNYRTHDGSALKRLPRAIRAEYNYPETNDLVSLEVLDEEINPPGEGDEEEDDSGGSSGNDTYLGAKLLPNVKGCGYPPILVCKDWLDVHGIEGSNFSCYYSRVDPELVITDLDMDQVYMNIVYAMAIPIPSFIVAVIYLVIAYFFIYKEEPATESEIEKKKSMDDTDAAAMTPGAPPTSGNLTPASEVFREDMASFGHQLKVAMADDISRDSVFTDTVPASSLSFNGSSTKMMTTSIITPPGPIADV